MISAIGPAGAALIKRFESCSLVAYKPTSQDVWTIGWGHTKGVQEGDTCTQAEADQWFVEDTAWAAAVVAKDATVPLNQNQFDALASITFNIGETNFDHSTLLKDIDAADSDDEIERQFLAWDKQRGKYLQGLENRREAEWALFETPVVD